MVEVNIHPVERVVRGVVGLGIVSLAFWGPKSPWAYLGLILVATAAIGWCPPYTLLGINTCRKRPAA